MKYGRPKKRAPKKKVAGGTLLGKGLAGKARSSIKKYRSRLSNI